MTSLPGRLRVGVVAEAAVLGWAWRRPLPRGCGAGEDGERAAGAQGPRRDCELHGHHRHGRHDSLLVVVEDRYKQLLLWRRTRGRGGGKYPPKQKEMCCWYWAWSACWAWAIVGPLLPLLFLWDRRVPDSLPFLPHSRRQAAQLSSDRRRRPSPVIMSSSSSKLHLPADDSVLLLLTHSNLSTFSSDIRVSKQVRSHLLLLMIQ